MLTLVVFRDMSAIDRLGVCNLWPEQATNKYRANHFAISVIWVISYRRVILPHVILPPVQDAAGRRRSSREESPDSRRRDAALSENGSGKDYRNGF